MTISSIKEGRAFTRRFLAEVRKYLRANALPKIGAGNFIVIMMSLCAYPGSSRPIEQNIPGYNEKQYL
jgi:hypothetical protein